MAKKKKSSVQFAPQATKEILGESWTPEIHEAINTSLKKGLVTSVEDLLGKLKNPDTREGFLEEIQKKEPKLRDKIYNWFRSSPWALATIPGIAIQADASLRKGQETPLSKGIGAVGGALGVTSGDGDKAALEERQREFQRAMLELAQQNVPSEIERIKQRRDMPFFEQAYGPLFGQLAQAQENALQQYMLRPGASYFTGSPQQYNPSGTLLGVTLGNLATQGLSKFAQQKPDTLSMLLNNLGSYLQRK